MPDRLTGREAQRLLTQMRRHVARWHRGHGMRIDLDFYEHMVAGVVQRDPKRMRRLQRGDLRVLDWAMRAAGRMLRHA